MVIIHKENYQFLVIFYFDYILKFAAIYGKIWLLESVEQQIKKQ